MLTSDIKKSLPYLVVALALTLIILFTFSSKKDKKEDLCKLKIAGQEITVELASTIWQRQEGLKHRDSLPENHGMLFIFSEEEYLAFWMKDTYIPLSIAFISKEGVIAQIESMEPLSHDRHISHEKAKYALEMRKGWFEGHNVKVGSRVELSPEMVNN